MTRKTRSHTAFEISPSPPIFNVHPETRRVRIQLGGDDSPLVCAKPGVDSQPLLASPSNSSPSAPIEPRRNHSHHSFFGLGTHQSISWPYSLCFCLLFPSLLFKKRKLIPLRRRSWIPLMEFLPQTTKQYGFWERWFCFVWQWTGTQLLGTIHQRLHDTWPNGTRSKQTKEGELIKKVLITF